MDSHSAEPVSLREIVFSYPAASRNGYISPLYDGFSFSIAQGSTVAIMGGSGSGKSTLGRIITGMITPEQGKVLWSADLANKRDLVYIDQNPMNSVFPWQKVAKNIEYPLLKLGWKRSDMLDRAAYIQSLFHLDHLADSFPARLSGGELQRLALARSLSWQPRLVVIDESFSALDQALREEITASIQKLAAHDRMTVVVITHNVSDALAMATRCVVIAGRPVRVVHDVMLADDSGGNSKSAALEVARNTLLGAIRDGII